MQLHIKTGMHARTVLLMDPPLSTPQVMGPPSQAHRLAALPDVLELAAWMLHLKVTAHSAPEAYAQARGLALARVLQQLEFQRLVGLRHCDTLSLELRAFAQPHCAPDELLGNGAGEQYSTAGWG